VQGSTLRQRGDDNEPSYLFGLLGQPSVVT